MALPQRRGRGGESLAAAFLELRGLEVSARNTRLAGVEVDLVAREGGTAVVVEVKLRARADFGGASLAVDRAKRERLKRAALALARGGAVRIDVVAVEQTVDGVRIRHFRNAVTD